MVSVSELASRSFIKAALTNPFKPLSVLSFFLGVDYGSKTSQTLLRDGSAYKEMSPIWFSMGNKEYDTLCQSFSEVIREGARTSFPDWGNTVDSKMAKIVLFDQLSRNCFRGTDEAYAYDYLAQPLARNLADYALNNNDNDQKDSTTATSGEMYGIYGNFCILTLMHSETPEDHELALDLIEWGESVSPNMPWDFIKGFELEHKAVIDRFGRYPHRNMQKNRESTKEEIEWLSKKDELPRWAK